MTAFLKRKTETPRKSRKSPQSEHTSVRLVGWLKLGFQAYVLKFVEVLSYLGISVFWKIVSKPQEVKTRKTPRGAN